MVTKRSRARRWGSGPFNWLTTQLHRRPLPIWLVCVAHIVALGIALVLYALPHHVIPHGEAAVGVVSSRDGEALSGTLEAADALSEAAGEAEEAAAPVEATMETEAMPEPRAETASQPIEEDAGALESLFGVGAVGSFRGAFPGMFTDGGVEQTENSYRSANISVHAEDRYVDEIRARVYVVDIYVADISCLTTAFSQDRYGRGYTEWITDVATRNRSVATLNGDYYGSRSMGVIIRNGELYRDKKYKGDIAVLYWDGHMETFKSSKFDTMTEMEKGAYQSWSFGPSLLESTGEPKKSFNCADNLKKKNPRSAIGYFEPGHYCFVAVDGRNDVSHGATMSQMATLMSNLGCKLAYNLDGGQTSLLALGSKLINDPSQGGRNSSDYIMIVDRITQ